MVKKIMLMTLGLSLSLALSACGGGGGGSAPATTTSTSSTSSSQNQPPPHIAPPHSTVANQVAVRAYSGADAGFSTYNRAVVSVTVCVPGTSTCQTIPNVLIDTGSSGLRLFNSALNSTMTAALQPVVSGPGALTECAEFAGGYIWGSVRNADVKLAGEVASNVPIQIAGDSSISPTPSSCSSSGPDLSSSASTQGANGIIGVSVFKQDGGLYFSCKGDGSACTSASNTVQVTDPVALFPQDNNGTVLTLPSAPVSGSPEVDGTLSFGVDTQQDNTFSGQFYPLDSSGDLQTTYNGKTLSSFVDSGSALYYFEDSSIPHCTTSGVTYYCPASPLSLSAGMQSSQGMTSISFSVSNLYADYLSGSRALPSAADSTEAYSMFSGMFDWGLPFFFGRSVATVFYDSNTATQVGPGLKF